MSVKTEAIKNFETIRAYFHTSTINGKSYWKVWSCSLNTTLVGQFKTKEELESYCDANFVGKYV